MPDFNDLIGGRPRYGHDVLADVHPGQVMPTQEPPGCRQNTASFAVIHRIEGDLRVMDTTRPNLNHHQGVALSGKNVYFTNASSIDVLRQDSQSKAA